MSQITVSTTGSKLDLNDSKINVLVLGNSGSGKSTLINAVLGEEKAPTGAGRAITREMVAYESDALPFRVIDTAGYEHGLLKQLKLQRDVRSWARDSVRRMDSAKLIQIIWFCIDLQSARLSEETLEYLRNVSRIWKNIPIIIVLTKAYSETETEHSREIFRGMIESYRKKKELNIQDTLAVVARPLPISNGSFIPQRGLDELIQRTNELAPAARKLNKAAIHDIDLRIKRSMAHSAVAAAVAGATVVGAVPIPIPDASVLVPLQAGMLYGISRIYDIQNKSAENRIVNTLFQLGGTTAAGRTLLNTLKAVPGLNAAGAVLNAIIAGSITFIAGELCITVFENVKRGKINPDAIDLAQYVTDLFNEKTPGFISGLTKALKNRDAEGVKKNLFSILSDLFKSGL